MNPKEIEDTVLIAKVLGVSVITGFLALVLAHLAVGVEIDSGTILIGPGTIVAIASVCLLAKLGY